jgi:hypothetical protein
MCHKPINYYLFYNQKLIWESTDKTDTLKKAIILADHGRVKAVDNKDKIIFLNYMEEGVEI